jgi:hypothetical protein
MTRGRLPVERGREGIEPDREHEVGVAGQPAHLVGPPGRSTDEPHAQATVVEGQIREVEHAELTCTPSIRARPRRSTEGSWW